MSSQADVHSIEALKDFRVALALFGEEALAALGAVEMEVRRTVQWLQHDRRAYWQEQIKRRREQVATAQAEVFRRKLAKTADYTPADERAEGAPPEGRGQPPRRRDAGRAGQEVGARAPAGRPRVPRRASGGSRTSPRGDVPRAMALLDRMIDALEAYLRVAPPGGPARDRSPLESIAGAILGDDPADDRRRARPTPEPEDPEPPDVIRRDVEAGA